MGILASELVTHVIAPTLKSIDLYSSGAEMLLLGTAAQESHLGTYLKQQKGIALGIWQIEPATHEDVWVNYLFYRPILALKIEKLSAFKEDKNCFLKHHSINSPFETVQLKQRELVTNLAYSCAIARVIYLRNPNNIPEPHDILALAKYWKTHYNTIKGKGTVEEFVLNFERI